MTSLKDQLREDRALRDAAREVIDLDIAHVKSLTSPEKLRDRTIVPAGEKAANLRQEAASKASDNKGKIAAIIGAAASAAILWAVREPLAALIDDLTNASEDDSEPNEDTHDA
jgi:hypothetical protein